MGLWSNSLGDWSGIVFGLGFALSFGYWTTNSAEAQRARPPMTSGRRSDPQIGAFPKIFIPFLTIVPGLIAVLLVKNIGGTKKGRLSITTRSLS